MSRWPILAATLLPLLVLLPAPAQEKTPPPVTGPADPRLAPFDELMLDFLDKHQVPGAALAVAKDGKLVYARGFGYADPDPKTPVRPRSKFRIASVSKPITAAAILRLVAAGKLKLDAPAFDLLQMTPPPGTTPDPRLKKITVLHLLQHTGGWDRAKSLDPMFRPLQIAKALGVPPPAGPDALVRYMLGQPLDFDPGTRYAYSNFGYCVLGRVVEKVSGKSYEDYTRAAVLSPLGMVDTRLGKTLTPLKGEVRYVDPKGRTAPAVVGPKLGARVPLPYGAWYLEAMDAHGGWVSSAVDLVKFGTAYDRPGVVSAEGIRESFARPAGLKADGPTYYGLGWQVRVVNDKGAINAWHTGALDGTASLLVRRHDGLCWAVLFNARTDPQGEHLAAKIDPLVHRAADRVKRWPAKALDARTLER
jgi:CubicO group peptidase (beta-lactamase class C family)